MGLDMYLFRIPQVDTVGQYEELREKVDKLQEDAPEMGVGELFWNIKRIHKEITSYSTYGMTISYWCAERNPKKVELAPGMVGTQVNLDPPNPREFSTQISLNYKVAYWRKFNALHKWFVENVQGGEDDCRDYLVTKRDLTLLANTLTELWDIYKKESIEVAVSAAEESFPTAEGFFFGGTEYDEYYWSSVEETMNTIKHLVNTWEDFYRESMIYSSSW